MSALKTIANDASVTDFINSVSDETKKNDSFKLLEIFEKITGEKATMWGPSIIGFGSYHYKSERSRQEGDWPLTGFSPRKQSLTLYILSGFDETDTLLEKLGKYKKSVGCLYINKLSDVDENVLKTLIEKSYLDMKEKNNVK